MAEGMLGTVGKLQQEGLLSIEDAVVASRGVGSDVNIKQTKSEVGKFTLRGGGIGLLAGILLGGPIGGVIAGTAVGAMAGKMKDAGIDDDVIQSVSDGLAPESSMLFLMVEEVDPENLEKVEAALRPFKANLLNTTLSDEKQKKLQEILDKEEFK
jgi:uncharacterized membrane protein